MNDLDSDDEEVVGKPTRRQRTPISGGRSRNLNEALALALANGFSADNEMEKIVSEEELKREEEEASSKMSKAEEKALATIEKIKVESNIETKAEVKDETCDIDDDILENEAIEIHQKMTLESHSTVLERSKFIPLRLSYEGLPICIHIMNFLPHDFYLI